MEKTKTKDEEDSKAEDPLNRREFLKRIGASAVASGIILSGLPSLVVAKRESGGGLKWDYEADVVVVGYGGGGACAAIEAHDAGAEVLILELADGPYHWPSTRLCGGVIYGAETSVQASHGITDSAEDMEKYWKACAGIGADPNLVHLIAEKSGENIEWVINYLGGEFVDLYISGAEREYEYITGVPAVPRGHIHKDLGVGFFEKLRETVEARGIMVMFGTRARKLLATPEKEVLGVMAERNGEMINIKGRRAVVLATGEFTKNVDMLEKDCPKGYIWRDYPVDDDNAFGDGQIMASDIGVDLVNMHACALIALYGYNYPVCVNKIGRRFVDESANYQTKGMAVTRQPDAVAFAIIDEDIRSETGQPEYPIQADRIEELAELIGVNSEVLVDTVDTYNKYCRLGQDLEFGKLKDYLKPIQKKPFWAQRVLCSIITCGGIRINTKAQALALSTKLPPYNVEVVPRLYAAGMVAGGGFLGETYTGSGSAVAIGILTGRIAGKNAAAETPQK